MFGGICIPVHTRIGARYSCRVEPSNRNFVTLRVRKVHFLAALLSVHVARKNRDRVQEKSHETFALFFRSTAPRVEIEEIRF